MRQMCWPLHLVLSAIVAVSLAPSAAAQTTWTVDIGGSGDHTTIQAAVNASVSGDTILVLPGTYNEDVLIVAKTITLKSTGGPSATVIQGTGGPNFGVVTMATGSNGILEGFSITGGSHSAPYPNANNPYNPFPTGGGIDVQVSSPTVRGNWVYGNYANYGGGGICITDSDALVEKNRIFNNTGGRGAGVRFFSFTKDKWSPIVLNNLIYGNAWVAGAGGFEPTYGGGVAIRNMHNMVFAGNTVWGNTIPATGRGAALTIEYVESLSPNVRFYDNIFYGNTGPSTLHRVASTQIFNCDIEIQSLDTLTVGTNGNIDADPLLVAPANTAAGDFRLQEGSPCIDAGMVVAQLVDDFDGTPRDATPDMGAYEYAVAGVPSPIDLVCETSLYDVTLSWANPTAYDSILIRRNDADLVTVAGDLTSYLDPALTPGTYDYEVIGIVGTEEPEASLPATCTVAVEVPAVTNLLCTADELEVTLSWLVPDGAGYTAIDVLRDGVLLVSLGPAAAGHVDSDVAPGTYVYSVVAKLNADESDPVTCEATTAVPPVVITACELTVDNAASVAWTLGSENYTGIAVLLDGTAVDGSPFDPAGPGGTSYTSPVLNPGAHTVVVRGVIQIEAVSYESADAACGVTVVLPPPTAFTCIPEEGTTTVQLAWTNGAAYDSVTVVRDGATIVTLGGGVQAYPDTVPGSGTYNYQVYGSVGTVSSDPASCGPVTVTYVPPVTGLGCTVNPDRTATLIWTNGSASYTGILVLLDGVIVTGPALPGDDTTYTSAALSGGAHTFAVRALIGTDQSTDASCGVTVPVLPPTGLTAAAVAGTLTVQLDWNNGEAYDSVTVRRNGSPIATLTGSPVDYLDVVPFAAIYNYEVRGTIGAEDSSSAAADPVEVTYVPPVTNLVCTPNSNGTVTLTWTNGSSAYTGIAILLDSVAVGDPISGALTTYTSAVLEPGAHTFGVQGLVSPYASTIVQCTVDLALEAPTDLTCAAVPESYTVNLGWTNGQAYETVTVLRDGTEVATLAGATSAYADVVPGPGSYGYAVYGTVGGASSGSATCGPVVVTYVAPVANLACTLNPDRTATLTWTNGSSEYDEIIVLLDGAPAAGSPLLGDAVTYTSEALEGGDHTFVVQPAIGADLAASVQCTVNVALLPPSDLACTAALDALSVQLVWANGQTYETVTVSRNGAIVATLPGSPATFTDVVPLPGSYAYAVYGSVGDQDSSSATCEAVEVTFVPPVTNLACTPNADGSVTLTWQNGSEDYTGIEVLLDAALVTVPPLAGGTTTYTSAILAAGPHTFLVRGLIAGYVSAEVGCSLDLTITAPSALTCAAVPDSYTVNLAWTNGQVYESVGILRNGTLVETLTGSPDAYADTVPGPGSYSYQVYGIVAGENSASASCGPIEVTYVPAVADLACTPNANGTVSLTWTNGSASYGGIAVLLDGAAVPTSPLAGDATSYTSAPLAPGAHVFTVRPVIGAYQAADAVCSAGIDVIPPTALACVPATDSYEVALTWTNGQTYDSVTVLRDGAVLEVIVGSPASYVDTVAGPASYAYAVRGTVDSIDSASASCGPVDITYVPAVMDLVCTPNANGTVTLTWVNGSAAYTGIAVLLDGAAVPESPLPGAAATYTSAALAPGAHTFAVQPAIDANLAAAVTCDVTVLVGAPTDLACAAVADSFTVELAWTNARTYDSVAIIRNGAVVDTIAGSPTTYTDVVDGPGSYAYAVLGTIGAASSAQTACGPVDVSYVPAVADLGCTANADDTATLAWTNGSAGYAGIVVLIDDVVAPGMPLAGSATGYTTAALEEGLHTFTVTALMGGFESADVTCSTLIGVGPPTDLACSDVVGEVSVLLTWTVGGAYDTITVERDGAVVTVLAGAATTYTDPVPAAGAYSYEVFGTLGGIDTPAAACGPVTVIGAGILAPVALQCAPFQVLKVRLTWMNPVEYDAIEVRLDGEAVGLYAGTTDLVDIPIPELGTYAFQVIGKKAGFLDSAPAVCTAESKLRSFIRADANDDGDVDIADGVFPLNYLFRGGPEPPCLAAADSNGDDKVDISDAVWTLMFLFLGGPEPPTPYPGCGISESPLTGPSCNSYSACDNP